MTHKLVHESKNYEFKCFLILIGDEFPVAFLKTTRDNGIYYIQYLDTSNRVIKEVQEYIDSIKWSEQ